MQKKFFIILIFIVILFGLFFWFSALFKKDTLGGDNTNSEDTNFVSEFFNSVSERIVGTSEEDTDTLPEDLYENTEGEETNNVPGIDGPEARLIKISSVPVAGYGISYKDRFIYEPEPEPGSTVETKPSAPGVEKVGILRYVNKINGNILQVFFDDLKERKFTSSIIPGIREAKFGEKGGSVIMRYLKTGGETIATYVAPLPKEILGGDVAMDTELSGSFLPENIHDVSVSPDGSKIFYIYNTNSGTVGIMSTPLGANKVQIFDSHFSEWISEWANTNTITMTTKASGLVPGYVYTINTGRKSFDKVLGGIKGLLTKASPDGNKILYTNSFLDVNIYDMVTKEVKKLNIQSLAEKCVWGVKSDVVYCFAPSTIDSRALHPDDWYQGEASFLNEKLWKIDLESRNETLVYDMGTFEENKNIDSSYLSVDESEKYLFFINSMDSHLWRLRLR